MTPDDAADQTENAPDQIENSPDQRKDGSEQDENAAVQTEDNPLDSAKLKSPEQRIEFLKACLSGQPRGATMTDLRLGQNRPKNILFGVSLHAAARKGDGLALSPLEARLVNLIQQFVPDEEIAEYGKIFTEMGKNTRAAGSKMFPDAVMNLELEKSYTDEDLSHDMDTLTNEIMAIPTTRIVDTSTIGEDGYHDSAEYGDDMAEIGSAITAFCGPNDRIDDSTPAPASAIEARAPLHVKILLNSFNCERRSGEVGKDEVYFAVSGGADGLLDFTHRSPQFGSLRQGDWRNFSGSAIVYQGPVEERLAATIEAWEQDTSDSGWYNAMIKFLGDVGDHLIYASVDAKGGGGWPVNKYTALVGATATMISLLMDWFRNDDDFVAKHDLVWTRDGLETILASGAALEPSILLDGGGGGRHRLWYKVQRESPIDSTFRLTSLSGSTWSSPISLPGVECRYVSLINFNNTLVGIIHRRDGRLLYTKRTNSSWSYPRTIQGGWIRTWCRPALAVASGQLWCAYRGIDNITRLARTNGGSLDSWTPIVQRDDIQYDYTYSTTTGPGLAWFNSKLYYALRISTGSMVCFTYLPGQKYMYFGPRFDAGNKTNDHLTLCVFRNTMYCFIRGTNNGLYHYRLNASGNAFESMPRPEGDIHGAPTCAVHQDRLWVTTKGSDGYVWAMNWNGSTWTKNTRLSGQMTGIPQGLESSEGKLWCMYTPYAP